MEELHGSITSEEKTFIETWENVAEGMNYIIQENRRGDEVHTAIVGMGRSFRLSTYERMLTEERILDVMHNPFKNGSFRPVIVPQGVSIETNPNAMANDDIQRLFMSSDIAWDEYMQVIDAPATLKRMIDLAETSGLSLKRYRQLELMYEKFTQLGKRLTSSKEYQDQIDSLGGPGSAPPTPVPNRARVAGTRVQPAS